MNIKQKQEVLVKILLATNYLSGQYFMIKDFIKRDFKKSLIRAIKYSNEVINEGEKHFTQSTEEVLDEDIDLLTEIIDVFIRAEEKGIKHKFKNDFYRICKDNNIKI